MPTYEYQCEACGHEFEKFQSMSSEPVKVCPKCGKRKVKRLIGTGAGLIFKGSGFYITDYRDKGYSDKAKAESGAASGTSESKGDAKPAESKEAKPAATETPAPKVEAPKKEVARKDSAKSKKKG
jgi:putative FmdB family regulatory protein